MFMNSQTWGLPATLHSSIFTFQCFREWHIGCNTICNVNWKIVHVDHANASNGLKLHTCLGFETESQQRMEMWSEAIMTSISGLNHWILWGKTHKVAMLMWCAQLDVRTLDFSCIYLSVMFYPNVCCCCNLMFSDWRDCVRSVLGTTKHS